jgi:hypothetical protein
MNVCTMKPKQHGNINKLFLGVPSDVKGVCTMKPKQHGNINKLFLGVPSDVKGVFR